MNCCLKLTVCWYFLTVLYHVIISIIGSSIQYHVLHGIALITYFNLFIVLLFCHITPLLTFIFCYVLQFTKLVCKICMTQYLAFHHVEDCQPDFNKVYIHGAILIHSIRSHSLYCHPRGLFYDFRIGACHFRI